MRLHHNPAVCIALILYFLHSNVLAQTETRNRLPGSGLSRINNKPSGKTHYPASSKDTDQREEESLTNESIISLVKAGVDDDLIVEKIRSSKTNFDLSTQGLIALKKSGVSKRIIQVMMSTDVETKPSQPDKPRTGGSTKDNHVNGGSVPTVGEIGFYLMENRNPVLISATGFNKAKMGALGTLGTVLSGGIKKGKVKAEVIGTSARVRTKSRRPVFLFYAPEGVSPSEYLVLKLQKKKDHREITVGKIGIGGSYGFEDKDIIKFSSERIGARRYLIRFETDLNPGEYCIYPTNALQASGLGVSATGKLYDFGVD
ncbi:MAG: hypothetical protein AB1631_10450 [Acidobacteriota bacterium]